MPLRSDETPTEPDLPRSMAKARAVSRRLVVPCPVGSLGFDTDTRVSAAQYRELRTLGFRFACRYLGDLTSQEVDDANGAGIGIIPVQHAHAIGWVADGALGAIDGQRAVTAAAAADLPMVPLWADLEGCNPMTTVRLLTEYTRAWCAPVVKAGHDACCYIGSAVPGNETELYELAFTGYWKSQSDVRTPSRRGWRMMQLFCGPRGECTVGFAFPDCSPLVRDLLIDIDVTQTDYLGGVPKMVVSAAVA